MAAPLSRHVPHHSVAEATRHAQLSWCARLLGNRMRLERQGHLPIRLPRPALAQFFMALSWCSFDGVFQEPLVIVGRDKLCACGERHAHYQTTIMRVHAASESHNIKWGSSSRTPL